MNAETMKNPARRMAICNIILLLTVPLNLACVTAPQETPPPNTVIVSAKGGGQYKTIGEALKGVQPGVRILVRPGLYSDSLIIDKPVEIIADSRGKREGVIIQSMNSASITMRTDRLLVRGLTIRHRPGIMGEVFNLLSKKSVPAVDIPQGQLVLEGCDITSNSVAGIA